MTWKLYVLAPVGALAAYLVSPGSESTPDARNVFDVSAPMTDEIAIGQLADSLRVRVAEAVEFQDPARDPFRFGVAPAPPEAEAPVQSSVEPVHPVVAAPSRPPFGLAGIATDTRNGQTERTAILTSLQGVLLVREGATIDGGYRVVSIDDGAVVVEAMEDGTRTVIRLSGSR